MGVTEIFSCPVPSAVTEDLLQELFSQLPFWRLEKALSYKRPLDQFLCAKSYLLLKEGLSKLFGISGNPDFEYGVNGKPSLSAYPNIHFNISHCPRCACCAISSLSEVGVDVEETQYDPSLTSSVFNASEQERIASAQRPEIEFTRLWTMKESYLKLTGEGLRDNLRDLLDSADLPSFRTSVSEDGTYVLTLASKSKVT